jgi:hypothetical protein
MSRCRGLERTIIAACVVALCARSAVVAQADRTSSRDQTAIGLRSRPVALNPSDPTQDHVGAFTYAGGLEISGAGTARLHGLSDLAVLSDDHLVAVTDEGDVFEARLVLDGRGRLSDVVDGRLSRLVGLDRKPLRGKRRADAEGLAVMPNGDRLVSFERDHRIWRYAASGAAPVRVPLPAAVFPPNEGIEALALYPPAGPNVYLAGSEAGKVWLCNTADGCRATKLAAMIPAGFALTGMATYGDDGSLAVLGRAYDAKQGPRAVVRLLARRALDAPRVLAELPIDAPLTRDNFEGIAAVPRPGGALRVYLVSDDNFSPTQHTYLLAFDWIALKR